MNDTPTIAKAKQLMQSMNEAAESGCSATEIALMARLVCDAWLVRGLWTTRLPYATLANRLNVSRDTVKRSLRVLNDVGLITYDAGNGRRLTSIIIKPVGCLGFQLESQIPEGASMHPQRVHAAS
jgi:DNA-binding transcriptional ArsR family regulator